ncbi:MAG: alpha/beta hydrolase [Ancalomicrobiaceae bacterium]|nr:alpha/beta hydrolase [Ancalomicrobiaceae bacterium]
MAVTIDPRLFSDEAIDPETRALNAEILAKIEATEDPWTFEPRDIRAMRALGLGPFPLAPRSPRAETLTIEGPHGPIGLRIIRPAAGTTTGVYLHIHGGGWVWGTADQADPRLEHIADACGFAGVSIDYRLAPEHPYPKGPDDCEAAALWLARSAVDVFGTTVLAIGGESAGAHLSVVTLLRLRDRHGLTPFAGANLVAGVYDLNLTPSARSWGGSRLILNTRDVEMFVRHFLLRGGSTADPDISPIHAKLDGLPPALFSVGTKDCLLDDSLFMAARWQAAGNEADLAVFPGGVHVFQGFDTRLAAESHRRMDEFLRRIASGAG